MDRLPPAGCFAWDWNFWLMIYWWWAAAVERRAVIKKKAAVKVAPKEKRIMDSLPFCPFHSSSIILSYAPTRSAALFLFRLLYTSSPLPFCSITTNHTSCWFVFLSYCVISPFYLSLSSHICGINQGMRLLVWCLWRPYMRLHGSNRRTKALSCRTPQCRPLSRASSVRPDPSASKSSTSEKPNLFIIAHTVQSNKFKTKYKTIINKWSQKCRINF